MTKQLHTIIVRTRTALFLPTLLLATFIRAQVPTISSVDPIYGNEGASVTITGTNFNTSASANTVYFGATKATVTSAHATSLTVTVPGGTLYAPVTVTNTTDGYTGYSPYPFLQTFDNSNYIPNMVNFGSYNSFSSGNGNRYCGLSDIDGDGKPDLLSANFNDNGFSVVRNLSTPGSLSMATHVDFAAGSGASTVLAGDIDGDGRPDVVVANFSGSSVSVFRNTSFPGSVSFSSPITVTTSAQPTNAVIRDIDGDGRADLAVTTRAAGMLQIFRNTGSIGAISFAASVDYSGFGSSQVAAGDIDGDGATDIVVANTSASLVSIYRNVSTPGIISLETSVDSGVINNDYSVAIGDLDGDGQLDIVATNYFGSVASVFRNTSSPGSISFEADATFTTGGGGFDVSLGDADGDGKADLFVTNISAQRVGVLRNQSTPGNLSFASRVYFPVGGYVRNVSIGDIDMDGKDDILASGQGASQITVLLNDPLSPISGSTTVCEGSTTTYTELATSGSWSSSNSSVASVGSSTGVITGVAAGSATITYRVTGGTTTKTLTVLALPDAGTITGTATLCAGGSRALSETLSTGNWSSGDESIATVDSDGLVVGIASGTTYISYTVTESCSASATTLVTVNPSPFSITGPFSVIAGNHVNLGNTVAGGTWSSSAPTMASVNSSTGRVTGLVYGSATITYTMPGGCYRTRIINVLDTIPPITGVFSSCLGDLNVLSCAYAPGASWTSSDPTVATIGTYSGLVNTVAAGTTTITFTSYSGSYVTQTITVNALPDAISGASLVCTGSNTTLTDATTGGTWSNSGPYFASIDESTGILTGIAPGTTVVTYATPEGCLATTIVTVGHTPYTIYGNTNVCEGSTSTLACATTGCTWSSDNTTVASISSSGVVSGLSSGTATISYSHPSGCVRTTTVSVGNYAAPVTGGGEPVTTGTTTVLGGNGSAAHTGDGGPATAASINRPFGVARDAAGNLYVCESNGNTIRKISPYGEISTVAGTGTVGFSGDGGLATAAELYDPDGIDIDASGNIYFGDSYNNRIRMISTSGIITTVAGNGTNGYSGDGGPATDASFNAPSGVTVDASGNLWIADQGNHCIRKVNAAGYVSTFAGTGVAGFNGDGIAATSAQLHYPNQAILDNAGNVYIADINNNRIRKVNSSGIISTFAGDGTATYAGDGGPATDASIQGPLGLAMDATGNVYVSDQYSHRIRRIATDGIISTFAGTGVGDYTGDGTPATATPIGKGYSITTDADGNVYFSDYARHRIWSVAAGSGGGIVCPGQSITLSNGEAGGTWSSSNIHMAKVNPSSGIVTGVGAGTATISYVRTSGCFATTVVTVNGPMPSIAGSTGVCVGNTTTLTNGMTGGTWSSSNSAIASIDESSGLVTGIADGDVTISYYISGGCLKTRTMTVSDGTLIPITGDATVCEGSTTVLTCVTGSSWSSADPSVATIGLTSGVLAGVNAGTTTITFTFLDGCINTTTVTVDPRPTAIAGTLSLCDGATTTLSSATAGGTWTSSAPYRATIDPSSGLVTGITAGYSMMSYTLSTGCRRTASVTVEALPVAGAITGPGYVTNGSTATLVASKPGGAWSSSNTAVATIAPGAGSSATLSGVSLGTAYITYTVSSGCGSSFVRRRFRVLPPRVGGAAGYDPDAPGIFLFPNPTSGQFMLLSQGPGVLRLLATDGRLVYQQQVTEAVSDITLPETLASGVYQCTFLGDDGTIVAAKLIYQR